MSNATADVQEVASCLNIMRPDQMLYEAWVGALSSGAYKFGYGVLRSGEDEYDPFGVLAATSYPAWTWDETESAWALDGDVMYLSSQSIAEWLGVSTSKDLVNGGLFGVIERFAKRINEVADGAADFKPVVDLLKGAWERAEQERKRLNAQTYSTIGGGGGIGRAYEDRVVGGHYGYGRR